MNPSGARLEREVDLAPGAEQLIESTLRTAPLSLYLVRGDAITVDGDHASGASRAVAPGRRSVTLLRAGQIVEARWIDVPPAGCRLVDTPELRCENP